MINYKPAVQRRDPSNHNTTQIHGHDFLMWQRNMSIGDLADWQANYGTPGEVNALSTTVPEPSALVLAFGVGLLSSIAARPTNNPDARLGLRDPDASQISGAGTLTLGQQSSCTGETLAGVTGFPVESHNPLLVRN